MKKFASTLVRMYGPHLSAYRRFALSGPTEDRRTELAHDAEASTIWNPDALSRLRAFARTRL